MSPYAVVIPIVLMIVILVLIVIVPVLIIFAIITVVPVIMPIPIWVSITLILAKVVIGLPIVMLWFNQPNRRRGSIEKVVLALVDCMCPRMANRAVSPLIAVHHRVFRVKVDFAFNGLPETILIVVPKCLP